MSMIKKKVLPAVAFTKAMVGGYNHHTSNHGEVNHDDKEDEEFMIQWIKTRIKLSTCRDISKVWIDEEHIPIVKKFLFYSSNKSLFATVDHDEPKDVLILTINSPPSVSPSRIDVAYFIRGEGVELSKSNIDDVLLFGTFAMKQTASSVLNIMQDVFYPNIFHTTNWNESSKRELMGLYHRFMASLTESANEESGRTTLYIPLNNGIDFVDDECSSTGQGNSNGSFNSIEKEWLQQLEGIAIHWIRQIKGVLNSHEHQISTDLQGPIEELRFWESRAADLSGILGQLQSEGVQNIVNILNEASSKYASPVGELKLLIHDGLKEAENIVKFLSILQDPCRRLSERKPGEIPMLFPELMNCARLIYFHSSNYNTYDRISDLLRRISSEITRQCSKYISLDDIFYGHLDDSIIVLKQCIECCHQWKLLYNRTSITVNKHVLDKYSPWQQNDASIFAEIDAFLQRCEDLIDVCYGRMQFVIMLCGHHESGTSSGVVARKLFKGMNGDDVERTLNAVSTAFQSQLDRLNQLEYNILDARSSQWHSDYNSFKAAMKDLDIAVINIINKAFDEVKVVATAVHILLAFREIASRPAITLCVSKKSSEVRMLFKRQCHFIRQEFDDFHRKPPLRMNEPQFAGAALWANSLKSTVEEGWNLIKNCTYIREGCNDDLELLVNDLKSALHLYQSRKYNDWMMSITGIDTIKFQERLNRPILIKDEMVSNQSYTTIASNFDSTITAIFIESHFWDKLHIEEFATPNVILSICHQREVLRLVRERVMMLVRAYNSLIRDLEGIVELYSEHLKRLEKRIYPGVTKVLWSSRQIVIDKFVQISIIEIEEIHEQVRDFHLRMKVVKEQCHLLTTVRLLNIDRNQSYKERDFENAQCNYRNEIKKLCIKYHLKIKEEMFQLYKQFINGTREVTIAWQNHVASVDNQILEALLKCVKLSLLTFSKAILGNDFAGDSHPLFTITVILKNGTIQCHPTLINMTNCVNTVAKELIRVTQTMFLLNHKDLGGSDTRHKTFYDEISSDQNVLDILVVIMKGTSSCVADITEKLLEWETYRSLWDMDKDSFLRRYSKTKQNSFETDIDNYQRLEMKIQKEPSSVLVGFAQLNFSSLKETLVAHSLEFREKLLDLLKSKSTNKLQSMLHFFEKNINALSQPVSDLEVLCNVTALLNEVEQECEKSVDEFEPLEKSFDILGKERINAEYGEMLKLMKPQQKALKEQIAETKVKMAKSKLTIKGEFQMKLSTHEESLLSLCNKVDEVFTSNITTIKEAKIWMKEMRNDVSSFRSNEVDLEKGIEFFGMDRPDSRERLKHTESTLTTIQNLIKSSESWQSNWDQWLGIPISNLDVNKMEDLSGQYLLSLTKMNRVIKSWKVWMDFRNKIDEFRSILPMIQNLLNEGMRERHWATISEALCKEWKFSRDSFTLNDILILGLTKHAVLIAELSAQASREMMVERALMEMKERILGAEVEFKQYKDTFKMVATDDLFNFIEDDLVTLQSIRSSNHAKSFQSQVDELEKDLNRITEFTESFSSMQRQWIYLENIFISSGSDIGRQLPKEYDMFKSLNDQFKHIMEAMYRVKTLSSICKHDWSLTIEEMVIKMEEVQKSLDNYLETKRRMFPRFYFISDDDLLDLVGKSKEPLYAQKHIRKCFEGVSRLTLEATGNGSNSFNVTGVEAPDGETLGFMKHVAVEGSIELWLEQILEAMRQSMKCCLEKCTKSLKSTKRELWVRHWQGQALITAASLSWTRGCERALDTIKNGEDKHSLRIYRKKQLSLLRSLTEIVKDPSQEKIHRSKSVALITVEVHNRDVIEKLIRTGCDDPEDFTWTSQLRFTMDNDGGYSRCTAKQTYCQLPYGYEYQGNNGRLVVTPLTDRCILTLITAKFLHRGGNPVGPAGTGKTETVKDLAKNLAYFCIVSNCSETMDFKSVGRIFSGLCQSGAWGCFDEFNRIKVEVISVVAMQISSIFDALRCNQTKFNFMGSEISCLPETGIFITMNPGYAGRSEIPDNLKALMRPIAMMIPDIILISEVILSSEGFVDSRILAKKIVTMYKLMQQQLSKQPHYDYGLRNIKSVLTMAGNLKQAKKDDDEYIVVVRAIKCMNEPKFIADDLILFHHLLDDIFPNHDLDSNDSVELQIAIKKVLENMGLQQCESSMQNTLQLAHSMKVRHCNMLIGDTMSGKTSILDSLAAAKQRLSPESDDYCSSVIKVIINPKALTVDELYGCFNTTTFEWRDGVISNVFKNYSNNEKHDIQKWLIFDGPVDALWIESMNSVMDDNKILTLVNGDRIPLSSSMALLFEVENLAVASPATVSRAGMIYIDNNIDWRFFLQSWVQKNKVLFHDNISFFDELCEKYLEPLILRHETEKCEESIQLATIVTIKNFTTFCGTFLLQFFKDSQNNMMNASKENIEKWFSFCVAWSIGGHMNSKGREQLDCWIREIDSKVLPTRPIFDYFINSKTNEFELWEAKMSKIMNPPSSFHEMIIPTKEITCSSYLLEALIDNGHRSLIIGNNGVGKTMVGKQVLARIHGSSKAIINLTSTVKSEQLQLMIADNLEKRSKDKLGPAYGSERLLVFIDDLNLPKKTSEESPYQPPLELLRHCICHGGWFNRNKCSWQSIIQTDFLCALTPSATGKTGIPTRLQSQFLVMNCDEPNRKQISSIFHYILILGFRSCQSEIKATFDALSNAMFDVIDLSRKYFLPIPGKSHYNFNLHDVMKVAQGMLLAKGISLETKESVKKLWLHECMRSFSDRFIKDKNDDESKFLDLLLNCLDNNKLEACSLKLKNTISSFITGPIFTTIASTNESNNDYTLVHTKNDLFDTITKRLEDYNESGTNARMNLVLFDDALKHICRITRILQMERSNMLFVGIGGSGRESLARLSAFIMKIDTFTLEVSSKYKRVDFREDLKRVCINCGIDNQKTLFFFKDKHIKDESVLEDVSSLMLSGEVPLLFCKDEKTKICDDIKQDALSTGIQESEQELWCFFIQRIQNNLHVIMAMSPIGPALGNRLRSYPALSRCTTINWFNCWPKEALEEVAYHQLIPLSFNHENIKIIAATFAFFHNHTVLESQKMLLAYKRVNHVTPANFLELVLGFESLWKSKSKDLNEHENKLSSGLKKLQNGRLQVEKMKKDLKEKQIIVENSQKESEAMLERVVHEKRKAEKQRETVIQDSDRIENEERQCKVIASEAEVDLAIALPALESALEQVQKLDKAAITEIKAYSNPPVAVERVLSCVMILLGQPMDWATSKRILGDTNFLTNLKTFDKDNVRESTMVKISKFIKSPSFAADEVTKVSKAAGALCAWCHAIHLYAGVAKEVAPKRARLKQAQESLETKQNDLITSKKELQIATEKLAQLRTQYEYSVSEKNRLKSEALLLQDKVKRAEKLIDGLSGEFNRWTTSMKEINISMKSIIGDSVVSAAFLSYAGPFDVQFRSKLISGWSDKVKSQGVTISNDFSVSNFLSSKTVIREWQLQGLPRDEFSSENAIMVTKSSRWPLLIDPQGQGSAWITQMENELKHIDIKSIDLIRDLELAISFGLPTMLLNTGEEMEASIEPILSKAIVTTSGESFICLGDKRIRYNENFQLYITTSLPNPHFAPEVSSAMNIINFSITEEGLEDQLLALVVNAEEPDLEFRKGDVATKLAEGKRKLRQLEDEILILLSESNGNLIDDTDLISTLQSSKTTSNEVANQLAIAAETEEKIDIAREVFRSAARRSSIIFFTLKDLSTVDAMYQFSLESYMSSFKSNILESRTEYADLKTCTSVNNNRVSIINEYHTLQIFESTTIGLFSKDKTLFTFQLCIRIMGDEGKIPKGEFEYFCRGKILTENRCDINYITRFEWLSEKALKSLSYLDNILEGFILGIQEQEKAWLLWYKSENPEEIPLPGTWESKLSSLQKLCVIRTMRPDRISNAVTNFITRHMGERFSRPPTLNLNKIIEKSSPVTPLIFILSSGVDPTIEILSLAKSSSIKLTQIALGQGQAPVAKNAIELSCCEGGWVLLANCHLMLNWLGDLEQIIESKCANVSSINETFRLWLTSKPSPYFPLRILQLGIKMTNEPPQGLRANMNKLYGLLSKTDFKRCKQPFKYKKCLFALVWLHSILLERRKFKTLGFNIPYDFNDSDFLICHDLTIALLDNYQESTPFKALQYLIGEANYGGRVTDDCDRKLLSVYVGELFREEMLNDHEYKLSSLPYYYVPKDGDYDSYINFIDHLPVIDSPSAFGQHPNASISSRVEDANSLLEMMSSIGYDKTLVKKCDDNMGVIISKLDEVPESFNKKQIDLFKQKTTTSKNPISTFILQEIQRYNFLLISIHETKKNLLDAMKGLIILEPQLERTLETLADCKVPVSWQTYYLSMKPLDSWIRDLRERVKQLNSWIIADEPTVVWLSGFTYPSCFLTCVLQTIARLKGCAIDSLYWEFEVMNEYEINEKREDGVYISGLYLEGAGWDLDNGHLMEPPSMTMYSQMPVILFRPTELKKRSKEEHFQCPLYICPLRSGTSQMSSFVMTIDLNSGSKSSEHWIKRGTAMLLSTSD